MTDDYEVVWNGTLDRVQQCPSLVSDLHRSTLGDLPAPLYNWGEMIDVQVALSVKGRTRVGHRPSPTGLRTKGAQ